MFSVLLGIYIGMELPGYVQLFEERAEVFSKVTTPFYFPTSNAGGFQGHRYFFVNFEIYFYY